ncbi:hypothetical protein BCR35DRAFT_303986 [Leucosporidium creatinivorum]|uniref:F-box domain-containing protein n=1 Tax=Leucosporidium creatinivorum TaxID=106004 RepID=A0A1Y2FD18_9BASI|nr:hypothetical protein BCR35DRAFT_303986 [Leucosporidium creatinivorum]
MASSSPPSASSSSSSATSEPSPFAALPLELKVEILAWTGIASPRALGNLSSASRELRKLSEPLRWKNLPIASPRLEGLAELVDTFLPLYGHHIRLLRVYPYQDSYSASPEATTRYYNSTFVAALPFMTGLRHLDFSLGEPGTRRSALSHLSKAIPMLSSTLTGLTVSLSSVSGVHVGTLLKQLPLLSTVRLSWTGTHRPGAVVEAFPTLHHLQSLRLSGIPPETMRMLRFSPQAPLSHLDLRNCGIGLHDLHSIIATSQQTLTSLVLCDSNPLYTSSPSSTATFHLPHLRDLSLDVYITRPGSWIPPFSSSPLHTLRCTITPEDGIKSLLQLLDEHRSTLKKLRVHKKFGRQAPSAELGVLQPLEEVDAVCRERGIDFVEGSWVVDEWEEHFGKWM